MNLHPAALLCGFLGLALPLLLTAADAESRMPGVQIHDAWVRLLPGTLPAGGFMQVENLGDAPRTLIGAQSDAWEDVELHRSSTRSGVSRMEAVDKVVIPPHDSVAFAPGGLHLMLLDRRRPLEVGEVVIINLRFADGHEESVGFKLRPANAGAEPGAHVHAQHGEHDHAEHREHMQHGAHDHAAHHEHMQHEDHDHAQHHAHEHDPAAD